MTDVSQRVRHQRDRIEMLNRQLNEPYLTPKERRYLLDQRGRAERRIAMLTEDDRRPTFAPPASKRSDADEYRDWLRSVG